MIAKCVKISQTDCAFYISCRFYPGIWYTEKTCIQCSLLCAL